MLMISKPFVVSEKLTSWLDATHCTACTSHLCVKKEEASRGRNNWLPRLLSCCNCIMLLSHCQEHLFGTYFRFFRIFGNVFLSKCSTHVSKLSPRDIYYRQARKTWRFAKRCWTRNGGVNPPFLASLTASGID